MQGVVENELWVWRNFRVAVPPDWEMLQFSRNPAEGRCAFADRYRYRLEMSWRRVDGAPDFPRMVSDYKVKLAEDGMTHLNDVTLGSWKGVEGQLGDELTSRLGRYFPGQRCVVELVFIWPGQKDARLQKQIALSADEEAPRGALLRWRAFGMDMRVAGDMSLDSCSILPASAQMVFENAKPFARDSFCRQGLVSEWLKVPVSEWLRNHLCRDAIGDATASRADVAGHEVCFLEGATRSRQMFVKRLAMQAAAWICPRDRRLYSVARCHHPKKVARLSVRDLAGPRLACCPGMAREVT